MRHLILTTALTLLPLAAAAEDAALVLGTERYEVLGGLSRGADVARATEGLSALGFDVVALPNGRAGPTANALADWLELVPEADRLIVVLSGRFATDGDRTWYLTADADAPGILSLEPQAVSVDALLAVLAGAPGRALLLIGQEADDTAFDAWLRAGVGPLDIPQGVTVLRAAPRDLAAFLGSELAQPGADLMAQVAANRRIRAEGFVPRSLAFMSANLPPPPDVEPDPVDPRAEQALWDGAVALDTVAAYRNYLARYPRGEFADQAETAIAAILGEPNRDARLAEESLNLTREQRRDIQRSLSLMEFDPRGIDGIFGPGSRRAITNWQQQNGFPQTSYLTPEQIDRMSAQAARRAAQLEAEAERQRQDEARRDRAYWEETGGRGDEAGLRAYLARYPDGLFADVAGERLAAIEADKRRAAEAEDRAAWDGVRAADRVEAYQDYLRAFPQGVFVGEARARIAALTQASDEAATNAAAEQAEQALGLNALTARLVEARLDQLGLEPGEVDGRFDEATRRALRRYQRDRALPVTGYLNEATVVRLLADSFGDR